MLSNEEIELFKRNEMALFWAAKHQYASRITPVEMGAIRDVMRREMPNRNYPDGNCGACTIKMLTDAYNLFQSIKDLNPEPKEAETEQVEKIEEKMVAVKVTKQPMKKGKIKPIKKK